MHPSSLHSFPNPCLLNGGGVRATGPFPGTDFFGVNAEFEDAYVGEEREGSEGGKVCVDGEEKVKGD